MRQPGKDKLIENFILVVDTREQTPWRFANSIQRALPAGDYTIAYKVDGRLIVFDKIIAVERKSTVAELYSATGSERERFEAELEKLRHLLYSAVICEFSFTDIEKENPGGKVTPRAVYGSIMSWWIKYKVPFLFAGSRSLARECCYKMFSFYTKYYFLGFREIRELEREAMISTENPLWHGI